MPVAAALLSVTAMRADAQPATRIPANEAKPATITGRVTAADTGKPLRRARVTVIAEGAYSRPIVANTNSAGLFEVKDVPAGSYYVGASRAGYLGVEYGQRRPNERGLAVRVTSGEAVANIDLSLPRGGVLAGRITDELNEPYPGVLVDVLAARYELGRRVPHPVAVATTDDLGQFRVGSLPPGGYYVAAASTETWRTEKNETYGYASTYYPGASHDQAQLITLALSQERGDINFSLHASRTARIRGRLVRENGQSASAVPVSLAYSYPGAIVVGGMRSVRTEADGAFEFKDVPPGVFSVNAGAGADEIVAMNGVDVSDLVLTAKTGSAVSGTVVTDEGPPPFPLSGVRVSLEAPDDKVLPTVRVTDLDANASFRFSSLGGPFLFRVIGLPDGWMLGSVRFDDKDITDTPWDVPTGGKQLSPLRVTVTEKVGTVNGTVVDGTGKPSGEATVVLFSDQPELWMPGSRFIRVTRPERDGHFTITNLPAGTYRAVARDFVERGQWYDRAFLDDAREDAPRIVLEEGGSETVTLKLQPPQRR
jgi:hypothetical protein